MSQLRHKNQVNQDWLKRTQLNKGKIDIMEITPNCRERIRGRSTTFFQDFQHVAAVPKKTLRAVYFYPAPKGAVLPKS